MPVTPYTFTWTGNVNNEWTNPGNWDKDPVVVLSPTALTLRGPNDDIDEDMDPDTNRVYVCIPAGAEVHIGSNAGASNRVYVRGIDLGPGATLDLSSGGAQLYVMGNTQGGPPDPDSVAQAGSTITSVGGTLGGQGTLRIQGTVTMGTAGQAAAFTTRAFQPPGQWAPPISGTLVVDEGGTVVLNSPTNLWKGYNVVVHGVVRMIGNSYIAADRGTSFTLMDGDLRIENDGDYFEGFDRGLATLSRFANGGRIIKTGSGLSGIQADYEALEGGTVEVVNGELVLPTTSQLVEVHASKSYSDFTCTKEQWDPTLAGVCTPEARPADLQFARFVAPSSDVTATTTVQVTEETETVPDAIGNPVEVHASGLDATVSDPAIIELQYDSALVAGQTPEDIAVWRDPDDGDWYPLPDCGPGGVLPTSVEACVDRGASTLLTGGQNQGDLRMVVHAIDTSRWISKKGEYAAAVRARLKGGSWAEQVLTVKARRLQTKTLHVDFANSGSVPDTITVRQHDVVRLGKVEVRWSIDGHPVTRAVSGNGLSLTLQPLEVRRLTLTLRPTRRAPLVKGSMKVSVSSSGAADTVKVSLETRGN